jgi:DNA-binding CsgD family transcriptional regulator
VSHSTVTPEQCAGLYRQGLSAPQIAQRLDVAVSQVRTLIKQAGVEMKTARRSAKDQRFPEAKALLDQKIHPREVCRQTGIAYQTLLRWMREDGMDSGSLAPSEQKRRELAPTVKQMYAEGKTSEQIASELGMAQGTVLRHLRREGVEIRRHHTGSEPTKREAAMPTVLKMHTNGATNRQIADAVGASPWSITAWLRHAGLKPVYDVSDAERADRQEERKQRREQAVALYLDGLTMNEIAVQVGADRATVNTWVNDAGVRQQGGIYKRHERDAAEAVRLYRSGMSLMAVCEQMGKSHGNVRGWLVDAGVEVQSAYERKTPAQRQAMVEAARAANTGKRKGYSEPRAKAAKEPKAKPERPVTTCAALGCDAQTSGRRYCSDEHRQAHMPVRQKNPDNYITFDCSTCGKTVTRLRSYGSSVSPGMRFCSNECATKHTKTVKHYVARESDMVLDSAWEMAFAGICGLLGIPTLRMDRERAVEWAPGQWYAPDFDLPGLRLAVEVKGVQADDDEAKWAAWSASKGPLVILFREHLDALRTAYDRRAAESLLSNWARL